MMIAPQQLPYSNQTVYGGARTYGPRPLRAIPLDPNWNQTWPIIRTILLASAMMISSAAIVGLDIANLAIEGRKQNAFLGSGPAKVGAGIWSGSISFLASIFISVTIYVYNKRVAATFALIAVTVAFFFTIVLVGLIANSIQIYNLGAQLPPNSITDQQYNLLAAVLAIALFVVVLCITYFIMYIWIFFSSATRRPVVYQ